MRVTSLLLLVVGLSLAAAAPARESGLDGVQVGNVFSPPSPPSVPHGGVYLDISVEGDNPAVLVGASSPASESVEIHEMRMDDGIMTMRPVERIEVPAGSSLSLRPGGGPHLMLINLVAPYKEGDRFPLTLQFAERGDIQVEVRVQRAEDVSAGAQAAHGEQ